MPSPPTAPELLELDPEAHTGLTNIVSGRLAIFEAKATETPAADSHSAQPTPCKESNCDESFEEIDIPEDDYEVLDSNKDQEIAAQRDALMASLKGSKEETKQAIGERLFLAIREIHGDMAGKLTGMFLEASDSLSDLALLVFSESSLRFHCEQALLVLNSAPQQQEGNKRAAAEEPTTPVSPDAPGAKRSHSSQGPRQFPYNGKKTRREPSSRPFFAEMTCDSGKRTRVPCRYDAVHKMYMPTGGRMDTSAGAKKVGTRDKTPEDLQALELGESDEGKLRARQKQLDIGKNTEGFIRLQAQGLGGRPLQDLIGLPYITEEGVLELTLKCSKKRYDGYLRMWKRKLYEFSGIQKMDFSSFPPVTPPKEGDSKDGAASLKGQWAAGAADSVKANLSSALKAKSGSSRKQAAPTRHVAKQQQKEVVTQDKGESKSWADMCN